MVELYDLKVARGMRNDGRPVQAQTTDLDHWPVGGIDEHIAQLDFETSSIANEESIFSSMAGLDVGLISTDSLDMEQLRQRCETKKNDYKLTFEDSGQWTTSGFGTGTSGAAIHEEDSSEEDQKRQSADLLLNNDTGDYPNGTLTFTTWGRIRNVETPYDPKITSMPSGVAFRSNNPTQQQQTERRPTSLLANFVERQQLNNPNSPPQDYEYSEQYLGNGQYVDLNDNQIGFSPANTSAIQQSSSSTKKNLPPVPPNAQPTTSSSSPSSSKDRWPAAHQRHSQGPPRRTFATLEHNNSINDGSAPDLNFLSLPFKVPNVCRSSTSLDEIFRYTQQMSGPKISSSKTEAFLSEILSANTNSVATATSKLFQQPTPSFTQLTATAPDSGFGSSGSNSIGGPAHIEDWGSLSILLPKHVVDACSFFKSNITLLGGGSTTNLSTANNSIERKSRSACRTCFGLRSTCLHPPDVFARSQRELCDCSEQPANRKFSSLSVATDRKQNYNRRTKLHQEELSIVGMAIYDAKRQLIERVVEGVAELIRGGSSTNLYRGLERLLSDGLRDNCSLWKVIVSLTKPGKATDTIYKAVQRLEASEKPLNSRIHCLFKELLRLQSMDGYLSYIVLKEKQLSEMYCDTAFLIRAHTAYRSLFWRLIESLELLSVLTQCERPSTTHSETHQLDPPSASRLPSDSRIPKSTSEPLRLSAKLEKGSRSLSTGTFGRRKQQRSSRIPVLVSLSQHRSRSMKIC